MTTQVGEVGTNYSVNAQLTLDDLRESWETSVAPLVDAALASVPGAPQETREDVLDKILTGNYRLITISRKDQIIAIVVLAMHVYPKSKALYMVYMAGEHMLSWVNPAMNAVERIAKDVGATRLESVSPPAIAKLLRKRFDFKERLFLTKDLNHG